MQILDAAFQHDSRTELPSEFENFFQKFSRGAREPLLDYLTRFATAHHRIRAHGIELPENVVGWMLIRRANV